MKKVIKEREGNGFTHMFAVINAFATVLYLHLTQYTMLT